MPWIRVDDHYDEHAKFVAATPLGHALWLAGMAYCNRNLTDGLIPWAAARSLLSWEYLEPPNDEGRRRVVHIGITSGMSGDDMDCSYVIGLLCASGLWEEVDGGYRVHDYLVYQPSRKEVLEQRKDAAERQDRARSRRKSQRDAERESQRDNGSDFAQSSQPPVPVPVPVSGDSSLGVPPLRGTGTRASLGDGNAR